MDGLHDLRSGLIRIGTFSSVATHWLPNMIKTFRAEYPGIEFELLLGDYTEIEVWIAQGRVDCGFVTLPVRAELDVIFLEDDPLLAILPEGHSLAGGPRFPLKGLEGEPFMLLEKGGKSEVSEIFERHGLKPDVNSSMERHSIMARWKRAGQQHPAPADLRARPTRREAAAGGARLTRIGIASGTETPRRSPSSASWTTSKSAHLPRGVDIRRCCTDCTVVRILTYGCHHTMLFACGADTLLYISILADSGSYNTAKPRDC